MRSVRALTIGIAAAAVAFALGSAVYRYAPRRVAEGQPPLKTVSSDDLEPIRGAFNEAADRVRVLALLSPT